MTHIKLPALENPVPVDSIVWIEGQQNYSIIHRIGQKPYLVSLTLKRFENQLPNFLRIHKSALINPLYVAQYEQTPNLDRQVQLVGGLQLPVSRRRVPHVTTRLGQPTA